VDSCGVRWGQGSAVNEGGRPMNRSTRFTTLADPASESIQHLPPDTYTCTIGIDP
jgi:hypothetical protein